MHNNPVVNPTWDESVAGGSPALDFRGLSDSGLDRLRSSGQLRLFENTVAGRGRPWPARPRGNGLPPAAPREQPFGHRRHRYVTRTTASPPLGLCRGPIAASQSAPAQSPGTPARGHRRHRNPSAPRQQERPFQGRVPTGAGITRGRYAPGRRTARVATARGTLPSGSPPPGARWQSPVPIACRNGNTRTPNDRGRDRSGNASWFTR